MPSKTPTQKELQHWLDKWQPKLSLLDWEVLIGLGHRRDFDGEGSAGEVRYIYSLGKAFIQIAPEEECDISLPDELEPYDPEFIVVHELLHLNFAPFWKDKKEEVMERAINQIAKALIEADRAKPQKTNEKDHHKS